MDQDLHDKLTTAGVDPDDMADPMQAWRRLHEHFGQRVTILDRYVIEAHVLGITAGELDAPTRARLGVEVLQSQFPGIELIGEPSGHPVEVVPFDPRWQHVFGEWRDRLAEALGHTAISIHHVGSTSVPGLAAKPIVDMQISVPDLEDEVSYVPAIAAAGVPLRSRDERHRYFRPASDEPRVVQIHVCRAGGSWAVDHVLFRDYLRAFADVRDRYAAFKTTLAEQYHGDRLAYTDGKAGFILDTLDAAREWAVDTGWSLPPN
jgi:GrpB-like predicted nucleotidyltransferase (UPF0157 family)